MATLNFENPRLSWSEGIPFFFWEDKKLEWQEEKKQSEFQLVFSYYIHTNTE